MRVYVGMVQRQSQKAGEICLVDGYRWALSGIIF